MKPAKMKKWMLLFMVGLIPTTLTIIYYITSRKLIDSIGLGMGIIFLGVVVGSMILRNPFMRIFEESEYLLLTFSSTGGIIPFTLIPDSNKLRGNLGGKQIEHIYDRDAVVYLNQPKSGKISEDDNFVYFALNKNDLNKTQFAMSGIPTFIWNDQLNSFMTKEMISQLETKTFARHEILYLNQLAKELNAHMLNFGRYVIDQTKPGWKLWEQGWFKWILIILLLGGLAYFILPSLLGGSGNVIESGTKAIAPVTKIAGS